MKIKAFEDHIDTTLLFYFKSNLKFNLLKLKINLLVFK